MVSVGQSWGFSAALGSCPPCVLGSPLLDPYLITFCVEPCYVASGYQLCLFSGTQNPETVKMTPCVLLIVTEFSIKNIFFLFAFGTKD
jgi:hypothetical protein